MTMAAVITIANEKGGVGKTTTAVNLAAGLALALADQPGPRGRVLLVDLDPQGHALLAVGYGQHQVSDGESLAALLIETPPPSVQRLIKRSQHHANLFFIPGSRTAMLEAARTLPGLIAADRRLLTALRPALDQFAYIIIDTPPNTGDLLVNGLVAATHILIPV